MIDSDNLKYTAQYVIDNVQSGTDMAIEYNGTILWIIGYNEIKQNKSSFFKKKKTIFGISNRKTNEEQIFNNMEDLFNKTIIEDKKLIDIWSEVEIISISGFDKY